MMDKRGEEASSEAFSTIIKIVLIAAGIVILILVSYDSIQRMIK